METDCPITAFRIEKVIDQKTGFFVPENNYTQLFSISNDGTFKLLEFNKKYDNYLVYINVWNNAIWSDYKDYIVDVSFLETDSRFIIIDL